MLHSTWRVGTTGYHDPMAAAKAEGDKHRRLTAALAANEVAVMQRDDDSSNIGLFSYKDLQLGEDGSITLTLVARVQ